MDMMDLRNIEGVKTVLDDQDLGHGNIKASTSTVQVGARKMQHLLLTCILIQIQNASERRKSGML